MPVSSVSPLFAAGLRLAREMGCLRTGGDVLQDDFGKRTGIRVRILHHLFNGRPAISSRIGLKDSVDDRVYAFFPDMRLHQLDGVSLLFQSAQGTQSRDGINSRFWTIVFEDVFHKSKLVVCEIMQVVGSMVQGDNLLIAFHGGESHLSGISLGGSRAGLVRHPNPDQTGGHYSQQRSQPGNQAFAAIRHVFPRSLHRTEALTVRGLRSVRERYYTRAKNRTDGLRAIRVDGGRRRGNRPMPLTMRVAIGVAIVVGVTARDAGCQIVWTC